MRNPASHQQWMHRSTRASERPAGRARFSGFFNGVSVVGHDTSATKTRWGKAARLRLDTIPGHRTRTYCQPGLRSPTSTRSLIEPSPSLQSALSPTSPGSIYSDQQSLTGTCCLRSNSLWRPPIPNVGRYGFGTGAQKIYGLRSSRKKRCQPVMSPLTMRKGTIRAFALSSIVSGFVLMVLLIVCTSKCASDASGPILTKYTDLILTITHEFQDRGFSICILLIMMILAMVFSYSFIRLCIAIAKRPKPPPVHRSLSEVSEASFSLPEQPVRVIFARDEESGLHEVATREEESNVQLPPPMYGLWRTSVVRESKVLLIEMVVDIHHQRVNPDLVHWQRRCQSSLFRGPSRTWHSTPSSLIQRPPSYTSY